MSDTPLLEGIRVFDLTRFVSGSFASIVLAAMGAEVLKVEVPPAGDPYRAQGTAHIGDESVLFMTLNSGKKSIALDFRRPEAAEAVEALLASCDVLVENARPGSLARHGLDYAAVHERHPHIVYGSISGFGDIGPEAGRGGFDAILQAVSGLMSVTGHPDSGPAKVGAPVTDVGAGLACVAGVLAALVQRGRTGVGRLVSSSLYEFSLASLASLATAAFVTGRTPGLLGTHSPTFAPYGAFRASDGWIVLSGAGSEDLWNRCCAALGADHLLEDQRFVDAAGRVEHRDALTGEIESVLETRSVDTWQAVLDDAGVPAGKINDVGEAFASPQARALGIVQRLVHPEVGEYSAVGVPIRVDQSPLPIPHPSPRLGEHTREALMAVGLSEEQVSEIISTGAGMEPA